MDEKRREYRKHFVEDVGWFVEEYDLDPPDPPGGIPAVTPLSFSAAVAVVEASGFYCAPWELLSEEGQKEFGQKLAEPPWPELPLKQTLNLISVATTLAELTALIETDHRPRVLAAAEARATQLQELLPEEGPA